MLNKPSIRTIAVIVIILLVAVWLRWELRLVYQDNEGFVRTHVRPQQAMEDARLIVEGKGFGAVFLDRADRTDDKGFALTIALVWLLTGDRTIESVKYATFVLDLVVLLALVAAVWKAFGRGAGLIAGAIYAVYMPTAIEVWSGNNYIFVPQFTVLILACLLWLPRNLFLQSILLILLGGFCVFATLIRGSFSLFPFPIALYLFLKGGWKRGALLATIFLLSSVGILAFAKVVLKNPTHGVWHAFYVGIGEFPNARNINTRDECGIEEVTSVQKGVNKWNDTGLYMSIIKGRGLSVVDEGRWAYCRLLLQRAWKLLLAKQTWRFFWIGPESEGASVITWSLFLLNLLGLGIAFREGRREAVLFQLCYLYFSLSLVPVIAAHPLYFIAASLMQVPCAAYGLSRLRIELTQSALSWRIESAEEEIGWGTDPFSPHFLRIAIPSVLLVGVLGVAGFFAYAHLESTAWKDEFLETVRRYEKIASWDQIPGGESPWRHENPVLSVNVPEAKTPYVLHVRLQDERGRVALEIRDATGKAIGPRCFSSAVGSNHCFLGWVPDTTGEVTLHAWDALPTDYLFAVTEWMAGTMREAYRHYAVDDHAKLEMFPHNRIEVSSSLFPNGYRTLPFQFDKRRESREEGQYIPSYWAARPPCSATVTFEHGPTVSQLVLPHTTVAMGKPLIQFRAPGSEDWLPLPEPMIAGMDVGSASRYVFQPTRMEALSIRFDDAPNEHEIAYLKDVCLPDPAAFRIPGADLYKVGGAPEAIGYPTRASFRAP